MSERLWDTPPHTKEPPDLLKVSIICVECLKPCVILGYAYNETGGVLKAHVHCHEKCGGWVVIEGEIKGLVLMLLEFGDRYGRGEYGQN